MKFVKIIIVSILCSIFCGCYTTATKTSNNGPVAPTVINTDMEQNEQPLPRHIPWWTM